VSQWTITQSGPDRGSSLEGQVPSYAGGGDAHRGPRPVANGRSRYVTGDPGHNSGMAVRVDESLDGIDWVQAKAGLAADDFDNGRSPQALRASFDRSQHVAIAGRRPRGRHGAAAL
jgi:hypothetical protein